MVSAKSLTTNKQKKVIDYHNSTQPIVLNYDFTTLGSYDHAKDEVYPDTLFDFVV